MRLKAAARHFSYRTVFHTVLILAFLLPFVFILTAVMTLEGFNKCSSLGMNSTLTASNYSNSLPRSFLGMIFRY